MENEEIKVQEMDYSGTEAYKSLRTNLQFSGEDKKVISIHDRKLDALEDLVEAANGKPIMVAYWYKHDIMIILKRFQEARVIDTSKDITDWNHGEIAIGLIHPASAGHGLNLQEGGCTIVWFGLTWSLELYQQMNARLW